MKHIERLALTSFRDPPRIWLRYVDDVFCVIKSVVIQEFLLHINNISPSIKFTVELEDNRSLPLLDVRVTRSNDSIFTKNPLTRTAIYNLTRIILCIKN